MKLQREITRDICVKHRCGQNYVWQAISARFNETALRKFCHVPLDILTLIC